MTDLYCWGGFICILCSMISYSVANRKGNNVLSALLVGFLLGPIGVLLACADKPNEAVLAERQKLKEEDAINSGELKKCPYCAELIKAEAIICKFCHKDLSTHTENPE